VTVACMLANILMTRRMAMVNSNGQTVAATKETG
jgi:hypothetical protein